jgi:hypothetical protein
MAVRHLDRGGAVMPATMLGRKPYAASDPQVEPFVTGGPVTLTALPANVNLSIYQGDDFQMTIAVNNPDGSPADLTGATVMSQIRAAASQSSPVLATLTPSISGNVISLHLASVDSAALPPSAVWDCQMTDAKPYVTTLVAGTVTSTPQVTQ